MSSAACALCGREITHDAEPIEVGVEGPDGDLTGERIPSRAHPWCLVLWRSGFGEWSEFYVHGDPAAWDADVAEYAKCDALDADQQVALGVYWGLREQEVTGG